MNSDHEYDSIMRRGDATEPQIPDGLTFREILFNYLDAIAGFGAYAANIHDRNFYYIPKRQPKHKGTVSATSLHSNGDNNERRID